MKIKITEAQAKSLGVLNENINPVAQFELFCKRKAEELNRIYGMVISLSVHDVLYGEADLKNLSRQIENIGSELNIAEKKVTNWVNTQPESDMDLKVYDLKEVVEDKVNSLEIIVLDLEKLQLTAYEHDLTKQFEDNKPIDITGQQ